MRSKVFFIGMDKAIEDEINNYIACQSTDQLTRPSKNLIKVFHVIFGQYGYPRESLVTMDHRFSQKKSGLFQ